LSVLENSNFYGNKKAYWINKAGKKTHRDMLREDVEYCLAYAGNMDQFVSQLQGLGYEYDYKRGSVRAPGWERAVRLRNLGYTTESLRERFKDNLYSPGHYYQWNTHLPYRPKQFPLLELERKLQFSVEHSHDAATVLVDMLFLMLLLLLQLQKEENTKVRPLSPTLRQEVARFDELQREYKFLTDNGIHTAEELNGVMADLSQQIATLEAQRQKCRNQLRRSTDPAREATLKEEAKTISKELAPLREKLRTANRIAQRYPELQKTLETERAMEIKARTRERERS
jgi:hypothetical protein